MQTRMGHAAFFMGEDFVKSGASAFVEALLH